MRPLAKANAITESVAPSGALAEAQSRYGAALRAKLPLRPVRMVYRLSISSQKRIRFPNGSMAPVSSVPHGGVYSRQRQRRVVGAGADPSTC
jgi:hypothetical protein